MEKIIVILKQHIFFGIGFLLTLSLLWPLFGSSYFSHHDDVQTIRLYEMDRCIKDGQIPCRWVPDLGGLYGYPLFNYYAPLPYYFGEIVYLASGSLIFSAKVMFAISFVGAYVFMYLLAKNLWGNLGGALSGIFYSFAPYHAVAFYVRGAMGEMWALMWYPALLWALIKLDRKQNLNNVLFLSLVASLLFMSHNLSTLIFLPLVLVFAIWLFFESKNWRFLATLSLSLILAFTLSAFYVLPMIAEKDLVHVETTTYGYFGYSEHFKGLKKLFIEREWGWGSSVREVPGGEQDNMSFQIGWIHLLGWLMGLMVMIQFWFDKQTRRMILFSTIMVIMSIFMIHPRSEPVWRLIENLKYLQFPWRFLMLVIFFISLVSGSAVLLIKNKWQKIIWISLVVLVVGANFFYFRPEKFLNITDRDLLTGEYWERLIKRSIFDFLPKSAKAPPKDLASRRYEILSGKMEVKNWHEGSNWIYLQAYNETTSTVRFSQYYFPNWKVWVDKKEVPINWQNDLGLITVEIPAGYHLVEAKLIDTPIRKIANVLTLLGIIIWIMVCLRQWRKAKYP